MPRVNNVGNISHQGMYVSDPDSFQMYQPGQYYSMDDDDPDTQKYTYLEEEEEQHQDRPLNSAGPIVLGESLSSEDIFLKSFKPGPNGYQEIPLEMAQAFFDVEELEDQACSSTGRTKFRMVINGKEMIIDGTVTPADEYEAQQRAATAAAASAAAEREAAERRRRERQTARQADDQTMVTLEDGAEGGMQVINLPESIVNSGQPMQLIRMPDGQLALQVTQMEQKQMAQVVTVDEEGNILSTDGTYEIDMPQAQMQQTPTFSMHTDEFGNTYLREEQAPATSSVPGGMPCLEVTGDPAEIAAMYPGMQMLMEMPDGTLEQVFADGTTGGAQPQPAGDTTYVNAKQYHRIMKRREARAKLEASGRVPKVRSKYLHESRHRHACNRKRGEGGKFNSRKELNTSDSTDYDGSPKKRVKKEFVTPEKMPLVEDSKQFVHLLPKPRQQPRILTRQPPTHRNVQPLAAPKPKPTTVHQTLQRSTAVITHLPLPPQNKARPPGFRPARPSEIKKLGAPTTYSTPKAIPPKVDPLPDKILEESPSNSPRCLDANLEPEAPDFSNVKL